MYKVKRFSVKHTEEWYKGQETKDQKKYRRIESSLSAGTLGVLTVPGASYKIGDLAKQSFLRKANPRVLKKNLDANLKAQEMVNQVNERMRSPEFLAKSAQMGKRVTPENIEQIQKIIREKSGLNAAEEFSRRVNNLAIKKAKKAALTTAAIGTAGTVGVGMLMNRQAKKENQKSNAKKRNKNNKK